MKTLLGCCLVAAAWMSAPSFADHPQDSGCSKNHFILNDPFACWQKAAPLRVARAGHTATMLHDGRVLVAGGRGEDAGKSAEIYDPATAGWTLAAPLHVARSGHTATLLADGRVLVLGGHSTYAPPAYVSVLDPTGEIYDPASDTWESIDGPLAPRIAFTATLLPDGKVLVAGGVDASDDTVTECELYDPATGAWTLAGRTARGHHAASLLADGA